MMSCQSAGARDYTPVEDTSTRVCFKRESRRLKKGVEQC